MAETAVGNGFVSVRLGEVLALFGDARGAPAGLASDALAEAAGAAVRQATGRAVPVLYARQEHTRLTFTFSTAGPLAPTPHLVGTCDAMLTSERWIALTVRTADCLPIVVAGGGALAIVHAGWRGLGADILGVVVERIGAEFGVRAALLEAAIGVGVGPCHYPVGPEVVAALSRHDAGGAGWHVAGAVDLAGWASGRLTALGLPEGALRVLPGCTACSPTLHSHRRDGARAGRQWTAAVITGSSDTVAP